MKQFITEKEDGKYKHFYTDFKAFMGERYHDVKWFVNTYIYIENPVTDLVFKYSIIPKEKFYTKTQC